MEKTMGAPQKQPEISYLSNRLLSELQELDCSIESLFERLGGVLSTDTPKNESIGSGEPDPLTDLGRLLGESIRTARVAKRRVVDMLDRIEL